MRLDKFLSVTGMCSRKEAKDYLKKKKITVNGETPKALDIHIDENVDEISFCGEIVVFEKNVYIMLNKPKSYVSANSDVKERTVFDLIGKEINTKNLFVAGRLDKDTEGFILLTDDGDFAHRMLSPKKHIPKTYFAVIDGQIVDRHIEEFEQGITIDDGYKCMPAKLEILKSDTQSEILLTIHEGKFHQVKRMFEAIGGKVIFLKRVALGGLELDKSLNLGQYKKLTQAELDLIGAK